MPARSDSRKPKARQRGVRLWQGHRLQVVDAVRQTALIDRESTPRKRAIVISLASVAT